MDLTLNKLEQMIYHKTKPNQQPTIQTGISYRCAAQFEP